MSMENSSLTLERPARSSSTANLPDPLALPEGVLVPYRSDDQLNNQPEPTLRQDTPNWVKSKTGLIQCSKMRPPDRSTWSLTSLDNAELEQRPENSNHHSSSLECSRSLTDTPSTNALDTIAATTNGENNENSATSLISASSCNSDSSEPACSSQTLHLLFNAPEDKLPVHEFTQSNSNPRNLDSVSSLDDSVSSFESLQLPSSAETDYESLSTPALSPSKDRTPQEGDNDSLAANEEEDNPDTNSLLTNKMSDTGRKNEHPRNEGRTLQQPSSDSGQFTLKMRSVLEIIFMWNFYFRRGRSIKRKVVGVLRICLLLFDVSIVGHFLSTVEPEKGSFAIVCLIIQTCLMLVNIIIGIVRSSHRCTYCRRSFRDILDSFFQGSNDIAVLFRCFFLFLVFFFLIGLLGYHVSEMAQKIHTNVPGSGLHMALALLLLIRLSEFSFSIQSCRAHDFMPHRNIAIYTILYLVFSVVSLMLIFSFKGSEGLFTLGGHDWLLLSIVNVIYIMNKYTSEFRSQVNGHARANTD